jgi:phage tail sheath protein FI
MPVIKTPGVYIEEISLFPPSVAEVATAIPAFIGYTKQAINADLKSLANLPVKISSLLEFVMLYGGPYEVQSYAITVDANNVVTGATPDKRFHLYDCLRQFFDNGGGDCYIVSVGDFSGTIDSVNISNGMDELKKYDEPTLIVFPDAVELLDGTSNPDFDKMADLQKKALSLAASMQDRFAVLDLMQGNLKEDTTNKPISNFRDKIGVNFLNYGAAYYPWVVTNYGVDVNYRDLDFGVLNLALVSHNQQETDMLNAVKSLVDGSGTLANTDTVTTITGLTSSRLRTEGVSYLESELAAIKQLIQTSATATDLKNNVTAYFSFLNTLALAMPLFETALPESSLKKDLVQLKKDSNYTDALKGLIAYEKHASILANTTSDITAAKIKTTIFPPLFAGAADAWIVAAPTDTDSVPANTDALLSAGEPGKCLEIIGKMQNLKIISGLLNGYATVLNSALYYENLSQQTLFSSHSFFKGVSDRVTETMRTIPPAATAVGIYALTDRTRGVWKAPANVSVNAVIGPAVKIDNQEQEDLNVHFTGKSINAIRSFTGKGTLVWGARTLAGNDNEWRYIPVRRFFIMVEESVKKAAAAFVFEPNDANTWTKVKSMIENFLTLQWRAGALQGAKPDDAFFVHIGLGATMSVDDVLNGKMIVEIGMAVVRPAEFIILRFSQKMMEA